MANVEVALAALGRRSGLLLALLLLAGAATAQSKQPAPIKLGQPDMADFEAKNFLADSGAAAVVLCDYGSTHFGSPAGEMRIIHDRVVRLKILKKAGYDYATVEIPLYHREGDAEKLSNLRGFTYVRGADGKLLKTKLETAGIFTEKRTDRVNVQKFTLPAVQEGAVVEYTYTVTSSFLSDCPDWTFQRDIPTRWSEYRTSLPLFYHYQMLYSGYVPLTVNEQSTGTVALGLTHRTEHGIETGTNQVSVNTDDHRWVVRNAPPVREEAYITTPADYMARINCELTGEQWPEQEYRDLSESWTKKNHLLDGLEGFGQALKRTDFLKELVRPLVLQHADPAARAAAVRQLILNTVKYDDTNRLLSETTLKRAWEQHRGTSADVNLLLIAALRHAGLAAEPVVLSTRAHGCVSKDYPQLDQFNYVLALVPLAGGNDLLLDATEPMLPASALPPRCLNKLGHTTPAEGEGRWVNLASEPRYIHFQDVKLTLDAEGNLTGQVQEASSGYAGLEARGQLATLGEKKYVAELVSKHANWEVPSYKFANVNEVERPLGLSYALRQAAAPGSAAQELYLSPLAAFGESQNPFRLNERNFPVDFGMQQQETINLLLTLPPGYVAELPKTANLALPNQGGRYLFSAASPTPGTVQLVSRLTLDKPVYSPEEYHSLRELYRLMLAKQAEALVIRKGNSQ